MNPDSQTVSNTLERDTVRSVSKLLLSAVALLFVLALLTLLPGVDRLVPETPVTVAAVAKAALTVVLVALLLTLAPRLASLARTSLAAGPSEIVENLASVVYWLVVLAAVTVAHGGFAGWVTPFLGEGTWVYDVGFLLLGLPVVVVVGARLSATLDPGADLVADLVVGSGGGDGSEDGDGSFDEDRDVADDATSRATGDGTGATAGSDP